MTSLAAANSPEATRLTSPGQRTGEVQTSNRAGMPGSTDDEALVCRLAGGDQDALAELFRRHGGSCYRLASQIAGTTALADDAVQEAFLGLWRRPAAYRADLGTVRAWLLGVTHHKAVDAVRRQSTWQRHQIAAAAAQALERGPDQDPATLAEQDLRAAEVRAAVADLPDTQREMLALAYFGGFTQTEIASITGVPLGTVKTRTLAAMRRLRLRLAPASAALPEEG
jgi:RNA polymerase sigma factor (sigma-70 family)